MKKTKTASLFKDNSTYLFWEMERLQKRIDAWNQVHQDNDIKSYHEKCSHFTTERNKARNTRRDLFDNGKKIIFELIVRQYELQALDEDVLMTLIAMHISEQLRKGLINAQNISNEKNIGIGFLSDLIAPPRNFISTRSWANNDSPLVRYGLVILDISSTEFSSNRLGCTLHTPHYIAAAVQGEICIDEKIHEYIDFYFPSTTLELFIAKSKIHKQAEQFIKSIQGSEDEPLKNRVLIEGVPGVGKTVLVDAIANALDLPIFSLDCALLTRSRGVVGKLLKLIICNSCFVGAMLHIKQPEILFDNQPELIPKLKQLLNLHPCIVVFEANKIDHVGTILMDSVDMIIHIPTPDTEQSIKLWNQL